MIHGLCRRVSFSCAFLAAVVCLAGLYECDFKQNDWTDKHWTLVKSPRWDRMGEWIQEKDCIRNQTPEDATPADLLGKRAGETYSSMVLNQRFTGNATIRATMSFEDRMAPLIVIAPELGKDDEGRPEYREHFEIVLFDQGVNVWHHQWADGKPSWHKAAYWRFDVASQTKHTMEVQIRRTLKGKTLVVKLGDREMGYMDDSLPDTYQVGVTGCEGVNRFYEFLVVSE